MPGPEATIERAVKKYAQTKGFYARKFVSPGHAGVPDHFFISPTGKGFFIEFKTKSGVLSDFQTREINQIRKRNFQVYVVRSVKEGKTIIDNEH